MALQGRSTKGTSGGGLVRCPAVGERATGRGWVLLTSSSPRSLSKMFPDAQRSSRGEWEEFQSLRIYNVISHWLTIYTLQLWQ